MNGFVVRKWSLLALKDGFTVLKNGLAGTRKQLTSFIERFHGGKIEPADF